MIKLYGSNTSPFVRRLRIWLAERPYDYLNLDIFSGPGRALLKQKNPTLKIPMLEDGEQIVFDSSVIYRYLQQQFGAEHLSWDQENQLTMINAANDSLVSLLICKRSNLDTDGDAMFFKLQRERVAGILDELEQLAAQGAFATWNFASISLYCLLDWAEFRKLADLAPYAALRAFVAEHREDPLVVASDPRTA